jgi:hypothetical protein
VFKEYLFKIIKHGLCVKIEAIDVMDNIILRKTADMKVRVQLAIMVLKLQEDEYFEG